LKQPAGSSVTWKRLPPSIGVYDLLFALWQEDFDSYAIRSEEMRDRFASQKWRIPILHHNGGLLSAQPAQ
jgi:hypothetical protein